MSNNVIHRGSYIRRAAGLQKSPTAPIGAPVSFTATSPALSAGQSFVFDTEALQPTYRQPYYIDEVRFRFTDSLNVAMPGVAEHGAMMKVLFQTGQEKISKIHIPAWLYCPKLVPHEAYIEDQDASAFTFTTGTSFYRWLLPEPLWMAPGDVLQASVERDAILGSAYMPTISSVTYIGRTLPPGTPPPQQRTVPWAGYVELASNSPTGLTAGEFVIADEQLRNPFMVPLHVQRLTLRGVALGFIGEEASVSTYQQLDSAAFTQTVFGSFAETRKSILFQMNDSLGYVIVPPDTLIGAAIEADRRAWTFERSIGPREALYPKITIDGVDTFYARIQVGMLSSRKVEL